MPNLLPPYVLHNGNTRIVGYYHHYYHSCYY